MADEARGPVVTETPKKRKINGRKKDEQKKIRLSSHVTGEDCRCARFRCFEVVSEVERGQLIRDFNAYVSKDAQDAYLSTLVRKSDVKQRRPREGRNYAKPKSMSVSYCVRVVRQGLAQEISVCAKAFQAFFGISKNRVETIRNALSSSG